MKQNSVLREDILIAIADRLLFTELTNKTILITGATGLIGSMLVRVLHAANVKYDLNLHVYGQIRNQEKAKKLFGDLLSAGDIHLTDREQTASDTFFCHYIIHTVSPTASRFLIEKPVETIKVSVGSTMDALEVAKRNKAAIVYLSSMEQYGIPCEPGQIMTENKTGIIDHLNVRSSYPESKRLCACLCAAYVKEFGTDVKIARLAQTFGAGIPLTDNRMPMQFARAAANGADIVLHTKGKSVSNFVYLTDAIAGILTILQKGVAGEAYNICNDKETRSVIEIANLVAEKVAQGKIKVKIEIPQGVNFGYSPDVKMFLNSEKLRQLGWNAKVDMLEAYKRLAEYILLSGVMYSEY